MAGSKSVRLFLLGDNKDARAKIEEVDLKAEELAAKHPELKIGIDAAKAQTELALLRAEIKKTVDAGDKKGFLSGTDSALRTLTEKIPVVGGLLSTLSEKAGNGIAGLAEKIAGDSAGSLVSAFSAVGRVASSGAGLGVAVGVLGAAATEAGALTTGVAAAGAGLGAFGVLALPTLHAISGAYTKLNTDQLAYKDALTKTARNTALAHIRQDWASLDPAQREAVKGLQGIVGQFHAMSKALEPQAMRLFGQGLGVVSKNMGLLLPLAQSVVPALGSITRMIGDGFKSKTMAGFLSQMRSLAGPVLLAVASGTKGLIKDVIGLMRVFSQKDVINSINIAFRILGATISAITGFIKISMGAWDDLQNPMRAVRQVSHLVGAGFDDLRHAGSLTFSALSRDAASMSHNVVGWFASLPSKILGAIGDLGSLLYNAGASLLTGLIRGIENSVPGLRSTLGWVTHLIPSWKGPADKDRVLLYGAGQLIMDGLNHGISSRVADLRSNLGVVTNTIASTRVPAMAPALAAAGRSNAPLQIEWVGGSGTDTEFITWLKKSIRIRGGDPGVLGR